MTKTVSTAQLCADATSVASLLTIAGYPPISKWTVWWHKFVQFQRQKMHPAYRLTCGWASAVGVIALPSLFVRGLKGKSMWGFWPEYWNTQSILLDYTYHDDLHREKEVPVFVKNMIERIQSVLPNAVFKITFLGKDPIITCLAQGEKHYVLIYDEPATPT